MINISIVDDHEMFRKGLEELLKKEKDLKLIGNFSGLDEFLNISPTDAPDILLLDLSLSGEMSINKIPRIQERFPDCRIIVLTMHNKPFIIKSVLNNGVRAYVVKDSPPELMMQAVRRVYRGHYYFDPELSDAIATLLSDEQNSENFAGRYYDLTAREQEVFYHLAEGLTPAQLGRIMFISKKTAENYRFRILKKLKLSNIVDLNEYARELGLL